MLNLSEDLDGRVRHDVETLFSINNCPTIGNRVLNSLVDLPLKILECFIDIRMSKDKARD